MKYSLHICKMDKEDKKFLYARSSFLTDQMTKRWHIITIAVFGISFTLLPGFTKRKLILYSKKVTA